MKWAGKVLHRRGLRLVERHFNRFPGNTWLMPCTSLQDIKIVLYLNIHKFSYEYHPYFNGKWKEILKNTTYLFSQLDLGHLNHCHEIQEIRMGILRNQFQNNYYTSP